MYHPLQSISTFVPTLTFIEEEVKVYDGVFGDRQASAFNHLTILFNDLIVSKARRPPPS
jgi:hypothetical protein